MACTAQELINADPCHACLTEQQGDWTLTLLLCMVAGGEPPVADNYVIGGEDGGTIIGGEGGEQIGVE